MAVSRLSLVVSLAVYFCILLQCLEAAKYPVWVKNCPLRGPLPVDDCILKRIRDALPYLLKGVSKYRLPQLEPLLISSLSVDSGSKQVGLSLKMTDTEIWGIKNAVFDKSKLDISNRTLELHFINARLEILGQYTMDGKVLILPIQGEGPGNITLTSVDGGFKLHWGYYEKNGREYARIDQSSMDFKAGHAYFHYKNLFNGDKRLGAEMNNFLNENWAEVLREFGPAVGNAFNLVFRQLIQNGFDMVPFDSFFPDGKE